MDHLDLVALRVAAVDQYTYLTHTVSVVDIQRLSDTIPAVRSPDSNT